MTRSRPPWVVVASLLLVTVACTNGSSPKHTTSVPGITATTVHIGSTQPLSGIVAAGYGEISRAAAAYFHYVNDRGGINSRTIVYDYVDDEYDPARTVSTTRTLVRDRKVFAVFNALGTATHQRVVDFLNREQVPDVFVASGCRCWDDAHAHRYTFGWQPSTFVEGKILGAYVKQRFAGKKVALFYQDDGFGREGVRGVEAELPGGRIVAKQHYDPTETNISTEVAKLQSAGADVVVAFTVPAFTAIMQLNMLKLHFDPRLVVSSAGSDPRTVSGLLEAIGAKAGFTVNGVRPIRGVITDGFLPSAGDPQDSWVQLFREVHDRYIPTLPFDNNVVYGMAGAYAFTQALLAAGPNPTRDGLVAAIERGLPAGPGLTPFSYSSSSHRGFTGVQIGVVKGRTVSYVGAPQTTDEGSGPIRSYDEPPAKAPASGLPTG